MNDYFYLVQAAESQLKAEGHTLTASIGDTQGIYDARGLLTRRAGYLINQVNQNIGLLEKTGGANSQGYATDIVVDRTNGEYADTCTDQEQNGVMVVIITWNTDQDPSLIPRWRQPTKELAGIEDGSEPPGPVDPPPGGGSGADAILAALTAIQESLARIEDQNLLTHQKCDAIGQKLIALEQQTSYFTIFGQHVTIHPNPV